jgi:hypothetical protein
MQQQELFIKTQGRFRRIRVYRPNRPYVSSYVHFRNLHSYWINTHFPISNKLVPFNTCPQTYTEVSNSKGGELNGIL